MREKKRLSSRKRKTQKEKCLSGELESKSVLVRSRLVLDVELEGLGQAHAAVELMQGIEAKLSVVVDLGSNLGRVVGNIDCADLDLGLGCILDRTSEARSVCEVRAGKVDVLQLSLRSSGLLNGLSAESTKKYSQSQRRVQTYCPN